MDLLNAALGEMNLSALSVMREGASEEHVSSGIFGE
jgi:hypothetical protein